MKTKNILIGISLSFCFAQLNAQDVIDRSKDKAEDKTNNRVDTCIDQGIDKGLNAIEGLFKKKSKAADESEEAIEKSESMDEQEVRKEVPSSGGSGMISGMFEAAKWNESYSFGLVCKVHITTTSKKGKVEESDMTMKAGKDCMAMTVEDATMKGIPPTIIFDYENYSLITLMVDDKGEKTGMAIAMNKEQIAQIAEKTIEDEMNDVHIQKTGKTKTIQGHTAYQYTFTSEDGNGEMWMAEDVDIEMGDIFGIMTMSNKKANLPENYPQGYLMETTSTDTDKGEVTHYLVTSLNENANEKVSTLEYHVMDPMGMMKRGQN